MRRFILSFGTLCLCSLALGRPARANAPAQERKAHTEVEGGLYYGQSSGFFGCGEQGRLRYAGGGVRAAHSMRDPKSKRGMGAVVSGAVTIERDHVRIDRSDGGFFSRSTDTSHRTHEYSMTSLNLKGGYHFSYFGFELGLGAWVTHGATNLQVAYVLPQSEITIGTRRVVYGLLGFGAPHLTMTRTFGPYLGVGVALPRGADLRVYYSHYLTPQTVTDRNLEAMWYVPIRRDWDLRATYAVAFYGKLPDHQSSLGARFKF